jgi:hypothetical protein
VLEFGKIYDWQIAARSGFYLEDLLTRRRKKAQSRKGKAK